MCRISPWSIPFMNSCKLSYVKVVDIMELYIWFFMHFIGQLLAENWQEMKGKTKERRLKLGMLGVQDWCLKAGTQIMIVILIMNMIWAWQPSWTRSVGFDSWQMKSYNFIFRSSWCQSFFISWVLNTFNIWLKLATNDATLMSPEGDILVNKHL